MEENDTITIWAILRLPTFIQSGGAVDIGSFGGWNTTLLRVKRSRENIIMNEADPEVALDNTFPELPQCQREGYITVARAALEYKKHLVADIENGWLTVGSIRTSLKNLYRKQK